MLSLAIITSRTWLAR